MYRKEALVEEEIYHIFNKSIAGFKIFNNETEYSRVISILRYYQIAKPLRFSDFVRFNRINEDNLEGFIRGHLKDKEKIVEIIAYCIMPTHIHLILRQLKEKGISVFMSNVLNSYTRYFNTLHKRKGPLWEGRFKNVLVETDEQLLHLTRYIHLNPVTAYLADRPGFWNFSSCKEYFLETNDDTVNKICNFTGLIDVTPVSYKMFVEDRISYQRDLAKIKTLTLD
ncbi:MAG: transposase [Candidatus Omnitrophota bacterium]|nr:transposase [Candidatus Omnitrophota bacterium]